MSYWRDVPSLKRNMNTSLHCQQCSYSTPCFLRCICRYLSYLIKICKDGRRNRDSRNIETCGGCICSQLSDTWSMTGNKPVVFSLTVGGQLLGQVLKIIAFPSTALSMSCFFFYINSNSEDSIMGFWGRCDEEWFYRQYLEYLYRICICYLSSHHFLGIVLLVLFTFRILFSLLGENNFHLFAL